MAFTNLKVKRDKSDKIAQPEVTTGSQKNEPFYTYGTRLNFDKDVLEKLGLDVKNFKTGDTMDATVKLEVVATVDREGQDYNEKSLELQVTDIDFGKIKQQPGASKIAAYKKIKNQGPTE